jgi:cardiolipin synthase
MPVRFPQFTSRANYRNHRKIFIIDGRIGYIGGMNIALRYVKGIGDKEKLPWRDTMARFEGSAVYGLQRTFLVDWYFVDRTLLSDRKYYPTMPEQSGQAGSSSLIQVVTSGPAKPYPEIMQGFVRIIMAAKHYIYIETPYFLPTESVLLALKTAASMGVDVRLLVPRRSDARFTDWASRSYLREAEASGMKVLLYEGGFLHSKFMVSDDTVSTCGSTNLDFRSFENNFEANAFFYDAEAACRLRDIFLEDIAQSTRLADIPHRRYPRFMARMGESFARLFSPLL